MRKWFFALLLLQGFLVSAQSRTNTIVSGPMIGHVELRTATIWVEFGNSVESAELVYRRSGAKQSSQKIVDFMFEPASSISRIT